MNKKDPNLKRTKSKYAAKVASKKMMYGHNPHHRRPPSRVKDMTPIEDR